MRKNKFLFLLWSIVIKVGEAALNGSMVTQGAVQPMLRDLTSHWHDTVGIWTNDPRFDPSQMFDSRTVILSRMKVFGLFHEARVQCHFVAIHLEPHPDLFLQNLLGKKRLWKLNELRPALLGRRDVAQSRGTRKLSLGKNHFPT